MPIERLRRSELPPEERAELEAALHDHERHRYEDRKIFVMLLVCIAAWLMVAEIFLLHEVRRWYGREDDPLQALEGFFGAFPDSLWLLLQPNLFELLAVVALPFVMIALLVHAWRTGKAWNGYALTSFGFVRIRGNALRVLRYRDISGVRLGELSETFFGKNYLRFEVRDENGRRLVAHGYSYESWKDLIEARRPASMAIDDPGKQRHA